jgi:hypothetical protein
VSRETRSVIAGAGLVAATPVAMWWVAGDRSYRGSDDLDYIFRPLDLPVWLEMLAGAGAVAVVMACVFVLAEARQQGLLTRAQVRTLAQLCVAGAIIGAGWRAVTAGVIGANIGGAMVLLFGLPLAIALTGAAVVRALVDGRRTSEQDLS